jgi:Holliday junction resolvase RusA-like endonuclease
LDNRAKCILDALKKVVYLDDSQVKILWTEKLFLKNEQESYFSICVKILDAASYKKLSMLTNNIIKI